MLLQEWNISLFFEAFASKKTINHAWLIDEVCMFVLYITFIQKICVIISNISIQGKFEVKQWWEKKRTRFLFEEHSR